MDIFGVINQPITESLDFILKVKGKLMKGFQ